MFLSRRSNGIYYLWYVNKLGKKHKTSTGSTRKTEALKFLQQFRQGEHEQRLKVKQKALSQFVEEFLAYARDTYSKVTVKLSKNAFLQLQSIIGDCPLSFITPQHVDKYKTERLKSISPVSVNIELRTLRSAFNTAIRWGFLERNPFKGVRLVCVPEVSPLFFTKEDFHKLISLVKEQWLKEMVIFAVHTGMRRGEIVNLRWQDVDFERKVVDVQSNSTFKTKQGKRRTIPLSDVAFYLLQSRHGKCTSEYIFNLNEKKIFEGWLTHKFKYYVYEARLLNDKLHFHSLRHTFASWLVQEGVSIYEVQKLLGHSSISVTQVYSHLQPERLHSTVNKISVLLN